MFPGDEKCEGTRPSPWTRTPPTEPGYYPISQLGACCREHPRVVTVVEVVEAPRYLDDRSLRVVREWGMPPVQALPVFWGPRIELPEPPP